jgi:hypothetical protein
MPLKPNGADWSGIDRVPRLDPEHITRLALLTLERASRDAMSGVVERTWGIRFALAYLHRFCMVSKDHCDSFWKGIADPHPSQATEYASNLCRGNHCNATLNAIYRAAGVERSAEMIYAGATGKRLGGR